MHVIDHKQFVNRQKRRKRGRKAVFTFLILVIFSASLGLNYLRPLPKIKPVNLQQINLLNTPVVFTWPKQGQAAIGAKGFNVLAETENQKPVPAASVAKVFTAALVLKKHPLAINQPGPLLTIAQADIDISNNYVAIGGSVVAVNFGEELSEYQALEALLVPSANNIADMLAIWAYGSMENYLAAANAYAHELGLTNTHIADASGFSPQTVSTPHDLVLLGQKVLENPVIAQIVDKESINLPVAGILPSTNKLVGRPDIIGIKTGHTDEAGGCYLFASRRVVVAGKSVIVVGAVMGAPSLAQALQDASPLLDQTYSGFKQITAIEAGQKIGEYEAPWGGKVDAITKEAVTNIVWNARMPQVVATLDDITGGRTTADAIGKVEVKSDYLQAQIPVVLKQSISQPSLRWRIFRFL